MHSFKRSTAWLAVVLVSLTVGATVAWWGVTTQFEAKLAQPQFLQERLAKVGGGTQRTTPKRPPALVRVAEARTDTVRSVRAFSGRLQEIRSATISSEVSGLIRDIPIESGLRVVGGETLLAQIDKTWLDILLRQTEAEIASLEAQLGHQTRDLARFETLSQNAAISASELSLQKANAEDTRQRLIKATLIRSEVEERLRRTTIVAPFDGYIVQRFADLGELVTSGTPIAEVISLGAIDALVYVNETFIDQLRVGETVPLLVDSLGTKVDGIVHQIVPSAASAARMFPVKIRLDDCSGELKVGMSVTAFIPTSLPKSGIVVPKDAVLERPDGDTVWVVTEENVASGNGESETVNRAIPVPVKIAATTIDDCQVVAETSDGERLLVAGARVVIEGAERLVAQQPVRVATISPEILEDLPTGSGHTILKPAGP
ncbi:MAG: efflux RND transporter periplasmic adaptor subunit [Thermoguttaceae bacterium]